jgi:hypothetical protein
VLMLSTLRMPAIAIYPDSDKVGVFPGHGIESRLYRRGDNVGYFDGEV